MPHKSKSQEIQQERYGKNEKETDDILVILIKKKEYFLVSFKAKDTV